MNTRTLHSTDVLTTATAPDRVGQTLAEVLRSGIGHDPARADAATAVADSITTKLAMSAPHPLSEPLVEGIAPACRGSISQAARSTRATALKQVSAIWWLLAP